MDPVTISRRIAKLRYAAVRRPLAFFDDRLRARYRNKDATLRSGFRRLLGLMGRFAGWLVADDTISRRGRDLRGRAGPASDPQEQVPQEQARHGLAAREPSAQPGTSAEPAAARTVDVTFTLPGEVGAGNVALCGDFNDWSAGNIALQRGSDGAWQVTLPLEPGRSYRYRYLLDGERWKTRGRPTGMNPTPSAAPTPS